MKNYLRVQNYNFLLRLQIFFRNFLFAIIVDMEGLLIVHT